MVAAQAAFNILDILKIVKPAVDFTAQVTGDKTWQAISGGLQIAGAVTTPQGGGGQTGGGDAAANATTPKTPTPKTPTPKTPAPIKGGHPDHPWTGHLQKAQQAATSRAELLKVKPGGYTKESGLQESYLDGLKQSGAKLDNKGQIVKQSGQAFKKPGWDRKAQLMGGRRTPDRLHRLRMLAIDKASVKPEEVQAATPITQKAETKREAADHQRYSPSKEFIETGEGENTRLWDDRGIVPKSEPESEGKPIRLPVENFDEEKYYKHKNGNWYKKGYDPGVTPL